MIKGTPNFVDCRFCGTSLRIVRTESAIFTEVHEAVKAISAEVSDLRKESKLRALDERWQKKRETLLIGHGHGGRVGAPPSKQMAQQMGWLGGITSLVMFIIGIRFNHDRVAAMMGYATGLLIATITFIGVSWILHRAKHFDKAEQAYLAERSALERGQDQESASKKSTTKKASKKSKTRRDSTRSST
jgi:cbb3-type cytochrome oxidase subunit 3